MKKPVLFLIFNRKETSYRVFEAIRNYQPEDLYIGADGPRPGNDQDSVRCTDVRKVAEMVDWKCNVHTLFQETNLGCRYAPPTAINWFFEQETEGIILEDDCLPSADFFRFCEEMLERYRDDERIMNISGSNFQDGHLRGDGSYYFSQIPLFWGWATWRRAWKYYDVEMSDFPEYIRSGKYRTLYPEAPYYQWRFLSFFKNTWEKSPWFNTWDYQWHYAIAKNNGYSISSNYNLISNIGGSGTHSVKNDLCHLNIQPLPEILKHPAEIIFDSEADQYCFRKAYRGTWKDRIKYLLFRLHLCH